MFFFFPKKSSSHTERLKLCDKNELLPRFTLKVLDETEIMEPEMEDQT